MNASQAVKQISSLAAVAEDRRSLPGTSRQSHGCSIDEARTL
jgi:hypothetical protein